jgi:hypothetical protein
MMNLQGKQTGLQQSGSIAGAAGTTAPASFALAEAC